MVDDTVSSRLIASYGRRRGRRLRAGKQTLFDTLLPQVELTLEGVVDWWSSEGVKQKEKKQFTTSLPHHPTTPLWLEIGFGGGEHLAYQAALHPQVRFLGCEPYVNGIAGLLASIEKEKLGNIRIYNGDARLLIERLPDASVSRVFILYPDPWPKARHHKRRLISRPFLDMLARVMQTGAELRLATDDADYCAWMLEHLLPHPAFQWTAKTCQDWLAPWPDWIPTKYEQKALAGRPTYLSFTRR